MKVTLIGDVHAKIASYKHLLRRILEPTIQVGDMGIGLVGCPPLEDMDPKDRWFDGNHDDVEACKKEPSYLGRFGVTEQGIYFAGGAFSVDAFYRTYGVDWFYTEQMNLEEFEQAEELYARTKPDVVATHDCPRSLYPFMLMQRYGNRPAPVFENNTALFLEKLRSIHIPKIHIYGHWHRHIDVEMYGTRFICLDELQPITLDF